MESECLCCGVKYTSLIMARFIRKYGMCKTCAYEEVGEGNFDE